MSRGSRLLGTAAVVLGALLIGGSGESGTVQTLAASTGQIYVAETNLILRVADMGGAGPTTLGTFGTGVGEFSTLEGIFVDGAGRIYVADSSRIVRINDITGAGWTTLNTPGTAVAIFVR